MKVKKWPRSGQVGPRKSSKMESPSLRPQHESQEVAKKWPSWAQEGLQDGVSKLETPA